MLPVKNMGEELLVGVIIPILVLRIVVGLTSLVGAPAGGTAVPIATSHGRQAKHIATITPEVQIAMD